MPVCSINITYNSTIHNTDTGIINTYHNYTVYNTKQCISVCVTFYKTQNFLAADLC